MSERRCISCGSTLHDGFNKNYQKCLVCQKEVCLKCSKLRLCKSDYAVLSTDQVIGLKKANRPLSILAVFLPFLAFFMIMAFYSSINPDSLILSFLSEEDFIFLVPFFILIFFVFLGIIVGKRKKSTDAILFPNQNPNPPF
ncbi:MAG: hypothetical protein ACTSRK_02930 [Promethearchaeota archaeon]